MKIVKQIVIIICMIALTCIDLYAVRATTNTDSETTVSAEEISAEELCSYLQEHKDSVEVSIVGDTYIIRLK